MDWIIGIGSTLFYLVVSLQVARWRYSVIRASNIDDWAERWGVEDAVKRFNDSWKGEALFAAFGQGAFWPVAVPVLWAMWYVSDAVSANPKLSRFEAEALKKQQADRIAEQDARIAELEKELKIGMGLDES